MAFTQIPDGLRINYRAFELDASHANSSGSGLKKYLLIGQKLASGTGVANVPTLIADEGAASTLGGVGSMLHMMFKRFRKPCQTGLVYGIALAAGVTAATGVITVGGTATSAGTWFLYLGGQLLTVPIVIGETKTTLGAKVVALIGSDEATAVTARSTYPVFCVYADPGGTFTFTMRDKGTLGNQVEVRSNYWGAAGGETYPAGLTFTPDYVLCSGGATDPALTTALANMGDTKYDAVVLPFTGTTELNAIQAVMYARWNAMVKINGRAYSWKNAAYADLVTFGLLRNDPHMSVQGIEKCPATPWEAAAAYAGACEAQLAIDPGRQLYSVEIPDILPPAEADRFIWSERDALLHCGVAQAYESGGKLLIERAITTYQLAGTTPDDSLLDTETLANVQFQQEYLDALFATKYPRHKKGEVGGNYAEDQPIVTADTLFGDFIAAYAYFESRGLVQNAAQFAQLLSVSDTPGDVDGFDVVYPPNLISQMRHLRVLNQIYKSYPANL